MNNPNMVSFGAPADAQNYQNASTFAAGSGRQIPLTCAGHTRPVVQLQFSRVLDDGNYLLVSACKDGSPMLRIGDTGDWIGTFSGHKGAVWCARLNEDASKAVTASADFTIKVWDTYTGMVQHTFPHKHVVRTVDISPDGRWVVSGGNEKIIRVFDLEAPAQKPKESIPHSGAVKTVLWDEWRKKVISAADEKAVKVWNCETLELIHTMETLDEVTSLSLSDDGEVIQATAGKSIYFWSAQSYELACRIDTPYDLSCVALHPLRDRFVCGSRSELWVRVFSFPEGEELEVYRGHHGPVHTIAYSPDGQIYASGSEDGTIRLWQTIPGTEYGLWRTHDDMAYDNAAALAGLPEGEMLAAMLGGMLTPEEEEIMRLQAEEEMRRQQLLYQQQQSRLIQQQQQQIQLQQLATTAGLPGAPLHPPPQIMQAPPPTSYQQAAALGLAPAIMQQQQPPAPPQQQPRPTGWAAVAAAAANMPVQERPPAAKPTTPGGGGSRYQPPGRRNNGTTAAYQ